jgi:hypothetical protein
MTDCGNSCPKMLLAVARFVCQTESNRGREALLAALTFAAAAFTCSSAARTEG